MTLEEGCLSLKLECALRELGFVEIQWKVIAHAGIFFVSPVGFGDFSPGSDLVGFQLCKSEYFHHRDFERGKLRADFKILPTAKRALDFALETSKWE